MNELKVFNSELIPVYTTDVGEQVVMGRELHEKLEIQTEYKKWFSRMAAYGFEENVDYEKVTQKCLTSSTGQNHTDHILKFDMAKHICMIQRTEKGKEIRQKLIELEKRVNGHIGGSYMIQDSIERAKAWIKEEEERRALALTVQVQEQKIAEYKPKADYCDLVLQSPTAIPIKKIATDYGMTSTEMNKVLHGLGIQYSSGGTWVLYKKYLGNGYTQMRTEVRRYESGYSKEITHNCWTQKGRLFLYNTLKENGILPVSEKA